jgi:hypothetical protein
MLCNLIGVRIYSAMYRGTPLRFLVSHAVPVRFFLITWYERTLRQFFHRSARLFILLLDLPLVNHSQSKLKTPLVTQTNIA